MKKLSLTLFLFASLLSCKKKSEGDAPKCVQDKIKSFERSSTCGDANVKEYVFKGDPVYAFDPGTCGADMTTEVISSNCNHLGYLGGISGNTKIDGEEFSNARYTKTVWKK